MQNGSEETPPNERPASPLVLEIRRPRYWSTAFSVSFALLAIAGVTYILSALPYLPPADAAVSAWLAHLGLRWFFAARSHS